MRTTSRLRPIVPTAAIALTALLLLVPQTTAAEKVPTIASTPQYKAFVEYVAKLRDLRNKAATAAQKARYESQLTNKHRAAANKASALFQRAKAGAKAETQRKFKAAAKEIRKAEAAELADLRAEYDEQLDDAVASFRQKAGALEAEFDARYATLHKQIRELRMEKAKAKTLARKDQIQAQINTLVQQVSDSRKQEREATTKLKDRYTKRKRAIQAARIAAATELREARQESVEALRQRWNRAYSGKLADLQTRRANQLAELEAKLTAGRSFIASMPVND